MNYFDNNNLKKSSSSIIYKAILKYGHDSFNLNILEYCPINYLIVREQYYNDNLKLTSKILNHAGSSVCYRYTEASKELIILAHKGLRFSPEHLSKLSLNNVRNKPIMLIDITTYG